MRRRAAISVLLLLVAAPGAGTTPPHKEALDHPPHYAGPGRDDPEPSGLQQVQIAYFGPADPEDRVSGDIWRAMNVAVDEANQAGGYRGLPYRLVPVWDGSPWGTGVAALSRLVYTDHVWAILGSIDGASTHLAEQVVAKARLSLVSPVSTDHTLALAGVPWMFSCLPGDDRVAALLADAVHGSDGDTPVTVLSSTEHDARVIAGELLDALGRRGRSATRHRHFEPGTTDFARLLDGLDAEASTVVILAGPRDSARLLRCLRDAGIGTRYVGGPALGHRVFLEEAGAAAEGAVFPWLCDTVAPSGNLAAALGADDDTCPDCFATAAYDATRLLIAAIERAGLNRARIRDALETLSPWAGAAGPIRWDALGRNQRAPRLATVRDGQIVLLETDAAPAP